MASKIRSPASPVFALLLACALVPSAAAEDNTPAPDTSKWKCEFCTFDYGWSGSLNLGLLGVIDSNYPYGEYSGLYDDGLYPVVGGQLDFRDKTGHYFEAAGDRLGLDSRWFELRGGRQGEYALHGSFRQTPQFQFDTSATPFSGAGSTAQSLPPDWVSAGSTAQMSALSGALRNTGTSNQRRSFDLGAGFTPPQSHWDFVFDIRHDERTGTQITGANFLTTTTQLLQPIDYRTDQVEAAIGYSRKTWQIRGAYYGSFFRNGDSALQWTNPFTQIVPGTDHGRMSVAPGNAFNQFSLTGGWQILRTTRLTTSLAYGRATQNTAFIASTINPELAPAALPATSLDGAVDTGNYLVRLTSAPWRRLSLTGEYLVDRRDTHTAQYSYPQVNTDAFVAASQLNAPYDFDRRRAKIDATLRITPRARLRGGLQREIYDRTLYADLRTGTDSVWAEVTSSMASLLDFSVRYSESRRRLDEYRVVVPVSDANNSLLRDFDVAGRTRNQWRGTISYAPRADLGLDLVVLHNTDNYHDSPIGLTADKDASATLDANWRPRDKLSLDAFATREFIRYDQNGSQSFTVADWKGVNRATVDTFGFSAQWHDALPNIDLGANYSFSYSRQRISVNTGAATTPFPDNTVNYGAARLWSRYRIDKRSTLRFQYAYERLSSADWALDGVEPDTISNVLALGVDSPRYRVNVFAAVFEYAF